jgi:hypothetical protein
MSAPRGTAQSKGSHGVSGRRVHLLDTQLAAFLAFRDDVMHIVGDTRRSCRIPRRVRPGTDDVTVQLVANHGASPRLILRNTLSSEPLADRPDGVTVGWEHHRLSVRAWGSGHPSRVRSRRTANRPAAASRHKEQLLRGGSCQAKRAVRPYRGGAAAPVTTARPTWRSSTTRRPTRSLLDGPLTRPGCGGVRGQSPPRGRRWHRLRQTTTAHP